MTKNIVLVLGIILALVGILGFFNNPVIGLFPVNGLHNIVHLLTGILAIVFASMSVSAAKMFSKVFGYVYLLVAILGFVAPAFMMSLLAIESFDNILHLLLAVVFLWLGYKGEDMMGSSMPAKPAM